MGREISIAKKVHCLVLTFPGQGHINPMFQFSKLLQHEGMRVTFVTTRAINKSLQSIPSSSSIALETISDGFDNGGVEEAGGFNKTYFDSLWQIGPKSLAELVQKLHTLNDHVDCIIYNSYFPWALEVAKSFGIIGVAFLTQNMGVNSIHNHVQLGKLRVPLIENEISLPLLPKLLHRDMPSFFLTQEGDDPIQLEKTVGQFSNIDKADWILCNSFYELEKELVDWTTKMWPKFRTIGPCIPSMFLDNRLKDDADYGLSKFKTNEECTKWLDDKPNQSVVYVSFGTMVSIDEEQMHEVAYGLIESERYFLWVLRDREKSKLPKDFEEKSKKGLVVTWCSQLKVLDHEAIGCFVTHGGWNSTLEALSLGVPTIAMAQWSDQPTNAKFAEDVWKMGIRIPVDEKHIVRRDALKHCILEIMEGEKGKEIRNNAMKWKTLAVGALDNVVGSSQKNIIEFVNSFRTESVVAEAFLTGDILISKGIIKDAYGSC